jgi:hypothetical protein
LIPIASRAGNGRTTNAQGTGLHAWLDDKLAMKVVSAMLTQDDCSIALASGDFKGLRHQNTDEKHPKMACFRR